jgi:hypothetical protein
MSTDRWSPDFRTIRSHWSALERDWQSVAVGAMIVATIAVFELQVPW